MGRLNNILMEAGGIGRNEDGSITRLGFSEDYFQALELIKKHMESLGMKTEVDPVGNLHGVLPGKDPSLKSIVLGSHLDTVIKGGVFDGMLGVAGAVECVYRLKEQDIILDHTLEIWGFNMEESSILISLAMPKSSPLLTVLRTTSALPKRTSANMTAISSITLSRATNWTALI